MRIVIATDAWMPQVNGVVATLNATRDGLIRLGHEILMITPEGRRTIPCPGYPEIRLAFFQEKEIARQLREFAPHSVHIATEGPLGFPVRCLGRKESRTVPATRSAASVQQKSPSSQPKGRTSKC